MPGKIIRARDVMQKKVASIDGIASAKEAADKMRELQTVELLVDKRNEDDAWGIVTIFDLVQKVFLTEHEADKIFVYEVMTKPVVTVPADMDLRYVISLMYRIKVRGVPVEENGEVVGMITLAHLVMNHDLF